MSGIGQLTITEVTEPLDGAEREFGDVSVEVSVDGDYYMVTGARYDESRETFIIDAEPFGQR